MIMLSMCQMCSGYVTFNISVGYVDLRYVGYWLNGENVFSSQVPAAMHDPFSSSICCTRCRKGWNDSDDS